jgi:hypothetical protein
MAVAARLRGEYGNARLLYLESIELNRELGDDRMVAAEHRNLAYVELHDGHVDRARELFAVTAVLSLEDGDSQKARELAGRFVAAGGVLDPDDAAELENLQVRLDEI